MAFTTVLSTEPDSIVAGDSVSWLKSYSDLLASDSWVLSYSLVKDGNLITISGTASGDDHLVELSAATTGAYTAGVYQYQAYVTKATERYKVGEGTIEILPNFATQTTGYDARSHVAKVYDNLKSIVEGKSQQSDSSYSIASRSISKMTWDEILTAYDKFASLYKAEQRKEKQQNGTGGSNAVKVRF